MKVKAFLTTHGEVAVSPTEPQPYAKVIPRVVKENIDTPIAAVVSSMINDTGKEAAMRTAIEYSNDLKTTPKQLDAVMRVAEEELGYVQPDISFEEKLAARLKNKDEHKLGVNAAPSLKKKMTPN